VMAPRKQDFFRTRWIMKSRFVKKLNTKTMFILTMVHDYKTRWIMKRRLYCDCPCAGSSSLPKTAGGQPACGSSILPGWNDRVQMRGEFKSPQNGRRSAGGGSSILPGWNDRVQMRGEFKSPQIGPNGPLSLQCREPSSFTKTSSF
jgi:hypothetical protein